MDKETARQLLTLVNDPNSYESLQIYADYMIEKHRDALETSLMGDLAGHQKVIEEFRWIKKHLRDQVREKAQ